MPLVRLYDVCCAAFDMHQPNILIITLLSNNHCPRTASGVNTNLKSISASGHHLPSKSLKQFGHALSTQAAAAVVKKTDDDNKMYGITSLAIGSKDMGDEGIIALCEGLQESNGGLLQDVDFGWKNL